MPSSFKGLVHHRRRWRLARDLSLFVSALDQQQLRPRAGMALLATRLRPLALRRAGGFKPMLSLQGGLEELRELRPIRSRWLACSVAKALSCWRSCSFSSSKACTWPTISLTLAGVAAQSASEIPAGGALITGGLYLRCNQDSSRRHAFIRNAVPVAPSHLLNWYSLPNIVTHITEKYRVKTYNIFTPPCVLLAELI